MVKMKFKNLLQRAGIMQKEDSGRHQVLLREQLAPKKLKRDADETQNQMKKGEDGTFAAAQPHALFWETAFCVKNVFLRRHYAPLAQKGPPVRPEGTPIPGTGKNKTFPGACPGKVYE